MLDKLNKLFDPPFFRFLLVGIVNTLVGTAVMFLLYNLAGLHRWGNLGYWLSTLGNYTVGSVVSFFLNKHFTFRSRETGFQVVLRFALNIVVCMVLAYGIAQRAVELVLAGTALSQQVQGNLSMLVGMGLFVVLNYLGQRFFAFRTK
ncbi:MAG: GtrA family protein [Lawsonibacter sp.]|nr:GtrA family protein [Lawsonibacter sp.]